MRWPFSLAEQITNAMEICMWTYACITWTCREWMKAGDILDQERMLNNAVSQVIIEMVRCKCKKGCKTILVVAEKQILSALVHACDNDDNCENPEYKSDKCDISNKSDKSDKCDISDEDEY